MINKNTIETLREYMEDDFELVVKSYIANMEECIEDIKKTQEHKTRHHFAHSLKGMAAVVGADELKDAAYEMEQAYKHGEEDNGTKWFMTVLTVAPRAIDSLRDYL